MENISAYHLTGVAMALTGALLLLQLMVSNISALKLREMPGMSLKPDHNVFAYRAERAIGNMNESVMIFLIFALVGILSGANPVWLGRIAMLYVIARASFAVCYWFDIKAARGASFAVSMLSLLGLGVVMAGGLI